MKYDAVVIGAGPAGSAAAREIAANGFKTLLLEEHPTMGQPLHCAGLVTLRTLALSQVDESTVVMNRIYGAYINTAGHELKLGGKQLRAVVMDRVRFDQEMARGAQESGAELLMSTRAVGFERENGHVNVQIESRGKQATVQTRLVVAADGAHSRTARWLGLRPRYHEILAGLGIESRGEPRSEAMVEVFAGQNIAPGFFAWMIPLSGGRIRVGIATANGHKPVHYLDRLRETFPRQFKGLEFVRFYGGSIPMRLWERTYDDNIMLVGDAAGQVKPTSGGGIYMGLVGAKHAAEVGIDALRRDDVSTESLSEYQRRWMADIGGELLQGSVLRRLYLSTSDEQKERALAILSQPYLRRLVNSFGDIDYPSRLYGKLNKVAPFIMRLLGISAPPQP